MGFPSITYLNSQIYNYKEDRGQMLVREGNWIRVGGGWDCGGPLTPMTLTWLPTANQGALPHSSFSLLLPFFFGGEPNCGVIIALFSITILFRALLSCLHEAIILFFYYSYFKKKKLKSILGFPLLIYWH